VAEVDGQAAGALCAFRAGDGYPLSQPAMVEVARSLAWSVGTIPNAIGCFQT
jgi:hypothetical protein